MNKISVTAARDELADALNRVAYTHESIVVTRRNRPLAAIVSMDDYHRLEELRRLEDELDGAEADRIMADPELKLLNWDDVRERILAGEDPL